MNEEPPNKNPMDDCGDHKEIARWRKKQSLGRTYQRRLDLIERNTLSKIDKNLLDEYLKENN